MKYDINNLPKKVKVVKENNIDGWKKERIIENNGDDDAYFYLGLEAGILEPYDEEEEEQEKLREEIFEKLYNSGSHSIIDFKKVLKDYKITKR